MNKIDRILTPKAIDTIKGFSILIIVFYHIASWAEDLEFYVLNFALPAFMFASGVLYFKYTRKKSLPFWEFITKKAKRLLVPYILLGVSYTIMKIVFFSISGHPYDITTSFENLIFNPWESHAVYLWFIYTLFIIFFIVHLTPDRYVPLLGAAAVVCYFLSDRLPSLLCMSSVAQYFIFFISGYCVYRSSANVNSLSSVIFGGGGEVHPLYFILNIYRCIVLLEPLIRCNPIRIHRPASGGSLFSSSIYPCNRESFFCGSL